MTRVWKLSQACRLGEFGCGFARMGLQFLPLLAQGSSYTGIDQSFPLVSKGRQVWVKTPLQGRLLQQYHTVYISLLTWSFGIVQKPEN